MRTLPPKPTPANMVSRIVLRNCLWMAIALLLAVAGYDAWRQPSRGQGRRCASSCSATAWSPDSSSRRPTPFPAQLERALKARGHQVEVINAGVSGDTTAAGLERLHWAVPDGTDAVIVELGANDALRGLDPAQAQANLDKIVDAREGGRGRGAAGRHAGAAQPGRGLCARIRRHLSRARRQARRCCSTRSSSTAWRLTPSSISSDGMHPNAKGVAEITRRILPMVEELIARVRARQTAGSGG